MKSGFVKPPKSRWFQIAAALGAGLAILLLIETVFAYHYAATRIAHDQALLEAVEEVYQEECIQLTGGEVLIAFSDGLMEATSRNGEEFGEARVLAAARGSTGSVRAVVSGIMDKAAEFMDGAEFHDDLTIFAAKLGSNARESKAEN